MRLTQTAFVVAILATPASTWAQLPPAAEPVPVSLPTGSTVRLQTVAAPGTWVKGILASANSAGVSVIPENAPPLGDNQLKLPAASVARFELRTGTKRQWLIGLGVGMGVGLLLGAVYPVDPETCDQPDSLSFCSRGEALVFSALGTAGLGAGIGALVKTDRWAPVALDALAPPAPRTSGVSPRIRLLPGGGVGVGLAVGF